MQWDSANRTGGHSGSGSGLLLDEPPRAAASAEQFVAPPRVESRPTWKHRAVALAERQVARAGSVLRTAFGSRVGNAFGVLMYHRITPRIAGVAEPTWNVTPDRFREQLSGLLAMGYRAVPLRTALAVQGRGEPLPPRSFVVTFDDGYANNYHTAFPILTELNCPATIFVATAWLDANEPIVSDTWSEAGSNRVPREAWLPLSTIQCAEMLDGGLVDIGTHTHTHADFRNRPEALAAELAKSLEILHERLGIEGATFAFPYGTRRLGYSGPLLASAARRAGVLCSLTTESELVQPGSDPYDWGRFTAHQWDTANTLAAKLDGWYSLGRDLFRKIARSRQTENT